MKKPINITEMFKQSKSYIIKESSVVNKKELINVNINLVYNREQRDF